ncbi:hypothetical protein IRJ41_018303 [Triplophysa rosa]|uniref:Uncharacterized protein n=1 Tax=Triplophysa rosa TaxID=992332 RepID=A0A9W7TSY9_TRIRA|nr:hypothetical protein IRJ41_018303 [Triplophysa rosa]
MDAGFFYPECRSERKLSALTLKHRAVHSISITVQAERTTCTDGREETAEVSEAGDVAPSEREDPAKTKNISDENGLDGFRRKSRSQLLDPGIRTTGQKMMEFPSVSCLVNVILPNVKE